ncbi:phosphatidylinositol 4-phosphate 5-kinase type-1 alpha-like isoform X4 [Elysia marginata]|uniref:Phosphatidylinositol 4-phosphate 5-kinase type-1 alpha-like isoform X4 n=1 Tax=Elysia marginata TaxID=1093978 RepID=A0AAV4ESP2_9GAST|nr:phosphatidylinositol 4-phosphate 5-kinase type-1 alpha-like isoform X4 [Elysia marginata]
MTTYPSEDGLSSSSLRGLSSPGGRGGASPPLSLSESTPTHTDFTEGTPSFTNSSPSCSSDAMVTSTPARSSARFKQVSFDDGEARNPPLRPALRSFSPASPSSGHWSGDGPSVRFSSDVKHVTNTSTIAITTATTTATTNNDTSSPASAAAAAVPVSAPSSGD